MALTRKKMMGILWAGGLALTAGVGRIFIRQQGDLFALILSLLGLFGLLLFFIYFKKTVRLSARISLGRKGLYYFLIMFLLGLLWTEINFLAGLPGWRWDMTRSAQHTLSETTKALLQGLDKNVKITVFFTGLAPKYIEDLLKEYARAAKGNIDFEIVDPVRQIGYAAQFETVIRGKENKAIIQSGPARRDIDFTDQPLTEEALTNAVIRVTRPRHNVYFLAGHGERRLNDQMETGLTIFAALLNKNGMEPKELMLGVDKEIPKDCDVLVLAGPQNHLAPGEADIVQAYLEKGGDALFLVEHTVVTTPDKPLSEEDLKRNPSLNNILEPWGMKVANDVVVDLSSHAGEDVGSPATRHYLPHEALVKDLDYTFYVRPRSISMASNKRPEVKAVPVVLTASSVKSWGEKDRTLRVKYDEGVDRPGPVPIAFVAWEPAGKHKTSDTRIIVFTDADFLSNAYVSHYSNAQMGLNAMSWLSELDYKVLADHKEISVERLDLTSAQKRVVIVWLFMGPVCVLLMGASVWMVQKE